LEPVAHEAPSIRAQLAGNRTDRGVDSLDSGDMSEEPDEHATLPPPTEETLPPPTVADEEVPLEEVPSEEVPSEEAKGEEGDPLRPGARFGEFELIRELGRGGMGQVYLARDRVLEREVALKLLSPERSSPEAVRRFEVEAQTAARLRHPGIVAVHRVGEVEGQAFIAMDYVEGPSLSDQLKGGPLAPRDGALLCEKLARALAFAHGRSVLHRDLKPGNVLIDGSGQPLITDFGLAKDVEAETELTRSGQILGTPAYMPPEQAAGRLDLVDRRSDVYSLGATLYAALTGRPPFLGGSVINVLNAVIHEEPPRPSVLRPEVDRSLETICLTCLAKEPVERYASAQELADDLGRYLRHEPIRARPPSLSERVAKWTRRNRALALGVGMTAAVALLVIVGGLAVRSGEISESNQRLQAKNTELRLKALELQERALEIRRQADALRRESAATAKQRSLALERESVARESLSEVTHGLFDRGWDHMDPTMRELRVELLKKTIERYETLLRLDSEHGVQLTFDRAEAIRKAAAMALAAGELAPARRLLERSTAALHKLRQEGVAEVVSELRIVDSLTPALLGLAEIQGRQGELEASTNTSREAVTLVREVLERNPQDTAYQLRLAQALDRLAENFESRGQGAKARPFYAEALEIARRVAKQDPHDSSAATCLHHALYHMGHLHLAAKELPESEAAFTESLRILRELMAESPHSQTVMRRGTLLLRGLASARLARNRLPEALEAFREGARIARRLVSLDPGNANFRGDLALFLFHSAEAARHRDQAQEALLAYREAITIRRALVAGDASDAFSREQLLTSLMRAGEILANADQPREALAAYLEALPFARSADDGESGTETHRRHHDVLERIGTFRNTLGDLDAAYLAWRSSIQIQRDLAIHAPQDLALQDQLITELLSLGQLQFTRRDLVEARILLDEALQRSQALHAKTPNHAERRRNITAALSVLGKTHWHAGRAEACLRVYEQAVANHRLLVAQAKEDQYVRELKHLEGLTERTRNQTALLTGKAKPDGPDDQLLLAHAYYDMRRYGKALPHFAAALKDPETHRDLGRSVLYNAACVAALVARASKEPGDKARHEAQAMAWLKKDLGLRRGLLARLAEALKGGVTPDQRRQAALVERGTHDHLRYARDQDPDLSELRAKPAFQALYADPAPAKTGD
jgi:serine/threonine protein kinase